MAPLRLVMNEIYLESNFVATFVWQKVDSPSDNHRPLSVDHDFIICYSNQPGRTRFHYKVDESVGWSPDCCRVMRKAKHAEYRRCNWCQGRRRCPSTPGPTLGGMSKGAAIRFAVGDPLGACSSNYRLWAEGRAGDVYVANRMVADRIKVSLHASGEYREAFTTRYMAAIGMSAGERARMVWKRLEPERGWIYAFRINIPGSQLRPVPKGTPESKQAIYWHPAPAEPDTMTVYTVLVGPKDLRQEGFPGGRAGALFLMGLTAGNGDRVALMVHETKGTREFRVGLERFRRQYAEDMLREGRTDWRNVRALLPGKDQWGVGNLLEFAVPDYSNLPRAYVKRHTLSR